MDEIFGVVTDFIQYANSLSSDQIDQLVES